MEAPIVLDLDNNSLEGNSLEWDLVSLPVFKNWDIIWLEDGKLGQENEERRMRIASAA